jgi:hypothetical protein
MIQYIERKICGDQRNGVSICKNKNVEITGDSKKKCNHNMQQLAEKKHGQHTIEKKEEFYTHIKTHPVHK